MAKLVFDSPDDILLKCALFSIFSLDSWNVTWRKIQQIAFLFCSCDKALYLYEAVWQVIHLKHLSCTLLYIQAQHNSFWVWKTDLSTPLNSPKDHVSSAIMFQVLLVTHFCTCEIGWVGVDYLEWDFSEQSSRHCPGASPTHACLMAVICEWDRTRSAHCASLMKTGRFSSDQAWNSQVVCPWHFSSVQIGMCGVMCMRERRAESQRASERERRELCFSYSKGRVVQN